MKTSVLLLAVVALAALSCVSGATLHGDAERERIHRVVNSANAGWTAGFNSRFAGRPIHAAKKELGVLPDNELMHSLLPEERHSNFKLADIPREFDPRKEWPMCKTIHEVRDQSGCGSCWAFGAVEAASDRICIATNGALQPHLSAQDMLACCSSCGFGCNGGYPSAAWSFLKTRGIVTGGNYGDNSWCAAYSMPQCNHHVEDGTHGPCGDFSTPKCPSSCDANSTYTTPFEKDKYIFNSSYSVPRDTAQIQMELMTRGPVEASFSVYADFMEYKSGVYRHVTGSYLGGHAVKLLGWGVDEVTNVPYWLLTNSWNEEWGEKGFFRVLRGSNECGIEGGLVAGMFSAHQ